MPIEPAVRETGCGHEIGEPDAIDTLCAKLARRRLDDLDACRGRFLARLSHRMCPPNRSMWAATNCCTVIGAWPVTRRITSSLPSEQRNACLIHFDRPAESIDLPQMGRWVGHDRGNQTPLVFCSNRRVSAFAPRV